MSRLRCRLGLHKWKAVESLRADRNTVECRYCRYRHSERTRNENMLPDGEVITPRMPIGTLDRA